MAVRVERAVIPHFAPGREYRAECNSLTLLRQLRSHIAVVRDTLPNGGADLQLQAISDPGGDIEVDTVIDLRDGRRIRSVVVHGTELRLHDVKQAVDDIPTPTREPRVERRRHAERRVVGR